MNGPADQICEVCRTQYPKHRRLVAPFVINDKFMFVCSICALKMIREEHAMPDYEFRTKANQKRHRKTLEWWRIQRDKNHTSFIRKLRQHSRPFDEEYRKRVFGDFST